MDLYDKFTADFEENYDHYMRLHEKLDKWRGKQLEDADLAEVNPIISEIQDAFIKIYPTINFVMQRYQFCARVYSDYNKFIDQIKSSGAEPVEAQS